MKLLTACFILLAVCLPCNSSKAGEVAQPSTDFLASFCNFPSAWTLSKGSSVNVCVVSSVEDPNRDKYDKWVNRYAPECEVKIVNSDEFKAVNAQFSVYVLAQISELPQTLGKVKDLVSKGSVVLIPCFVMPGTKTNELSWNSFLQQAGAAGAIIVGVHGHQYEIGSIVTWKSRSVDVLGLNPNYGEQTYMDPANPIDGGADYSVCVAAAAAAIYVATHPNFTVQQVKLAFTDQAKRYRWVEYEMTRGDKTRRNVRCFNSEESYQEFLKGPDSPEIQWEIVNTLNCCVIDAGAIVGARPLSAGRWAHEALNLDQAHSLATGKGITVAVLDHLFGKDEEVFRDRVVAPGCVIEGYSAFDENGYSEHGTWMAQHAVAIAPDIKLMPVRICNRQHRGDPDMYIAGIKYAADNNADIMTISHQAIPGDRQGDFDDAVEYATKRGATLVFIHYKGSRNDVVISGPIEFAKSDIDSERIVHVVGTNSAGGFPYTWGLSQTAPIVGGVIALMKEVNPELTPRQINKLLCASGNQTEDGYLYLDAVLAINKATELKP